MNLKPKSNRTAGFAMLEVLVSVIVMAFGMLGIAGMLLMAHKSNSSSYLKQQAVQSAYDILDRVRVNRAAAIGGSYVFSNIASSGAPTIPATASPDCNSGACTAAQLATYDLWFWLARDVSQLPNGCGSVATAVSGSNTLVTVTVQWDDSPAQSTLGGASKTVGASANLAQFTVQTLL